MNAMQILNAYKTIRLYKWIFVCLIMICIMPSVVSGQMNARSLGMANAYTGLARGIHAPLWNPANLGLPDNPKFSMSLISLAVGITNNMFSKSMYDEYFTNGDENNEIYWSPDDINEILSRIPDNGMTLNVGATVRALSFSAGKFAFSVGASARSYVQFDKAFLELPLKGNEMNQIYDFSDTDAEGVGVGVVGFSYGHPIPVNFADHFALGGTLHLIYGGAYSNVDQAQFTLKTANDGFEINGNYTFTYALGGIGWGADIGAAAQFQEEWTVSLAIGNVLGSIPWAREVNTEYGVFVGDSITAENTDDVLSDSTWSVEGASFSEKLPTVIRLGCAYQEGSVLLTADWTQGFEKGAWTSTTPQISVGTEWKGVRWLPLRAGIALGGKIGFGTSLGFGLHPGVFVLDFGVLSRGLIFPNISKGYIIGLEMGLELD